MTKWITVEEWETESVAIRIEVSEALPLTLGSHRYELSRDSMN